MDSAPETRSWMANWRDQKKMNILRVVDRSVAILDGPWRKSFEKYAKRCDFHDFWRFFINSGGVPVGPGLEIWTYILFGPISMSTVRFLNNLFGSWGSRVRWIQNTTPGPPLRPVPGCAEFGPSTGQKGCGGSEIEIVRESTSGKLPNMRHVISERWIQLASQPRWNRGRFHHEMNFFCLSEEVNACPRRFA